MVSSDPIKWLQQIQNGIDPRQNKSELIALFEELDRENKGKPKHSDWLTLKNAILELLPYEDVPLDKSIFAAKALLEYKHPKLKQVTSNDRANTIKESPLTVEEIKTLKNTWNEQY